MPSQASNPLRIGIYKSRTIRSKASFYLVTRSKAFCPFWTFVMLQFVFCSNLKDVASSCMYSSFATNILIYWSSISFSLSYFSSSSLIESSASKLWYNDFFEDKSDTKEFFLNDWYCSWIMHFKLSIFVKDWIIFLTFLFFLSSVFTFVGFNLLDDYLFLTYEKLFYNIFSV